MARCPKPGARRPGRAASGPCFRGPLGARAPALWTTSRPPGLLSPGAYKYPPGVFSWEISRVQSGSCYFVVRICSFCCCSSSSFSFSHYSERESVCKVLYLKGDKLIQVLLLFLLSIYLCFHLLLIPCCSVTLFTLYFSPLQCNLPSLYFFSFCCFFLIMSN